MHYFILATNVLGLHFYRAVEQDRRRTVFHERQFLATRKGKTVVTNTVREAVLHVL